MNSIALVGAGGHGKVVADIAAQKGYKKIEFFDDNYPQKQKLGPWPIMGRVDALKGNIGDYNKVIVTIGDNLTRAKIAKEVEGIVGMATLIHPSAIVSDYADILAGTAVMANAVINPYSTIEENVIVNTSAIVDHDCLIQEFSHISPGAILAGNVTIGPNSWIGLGARIIQGVTLGKGVIVAAGSTVTKSYPGKVMLAGTPAKIKREL